MVTASSWVESLHQHSCTALSDCCVRCFCFLIQTTEFIKPYIWDTAAYQIKQDSPMAMMCVTYLQYSCVQLTGIAHSLVTNLWPWCRACNLHQRPGATEGVKETKSMLAAKIHYAQTIIHIFPQTYALSAVNSITPPKWNTLGFRKPKLSSCTYNCHMRVNWSYLLSKFIFHRQGYNVFRISNWIYCGKGNETHMNSRLEGQQRRREMRRQMKQLGGLGCIQ